MVKQTTVISMRLPARSGKRLATMARRHGWTVSDTSARLVEESLRRGEFAFIDFRDSPVGRQAYLQGSSLGVWEVMMLARRCNHDPARVAKHLRWPLRKVQSAFNYAEAFPEEIQTALAENSSADATALARLLPELEIIKAKSR